MLVFNLAQNVSPFKIYLMVVTLVYVGSPVFICSCNLLDDIKNSFPDSYTHTAIYTERKINKLCTNVNKPKNIYPMRVHSSSHPHICL